MIAMATKRRSRSCTPTRRSLQAAYAQGIFLQLPGPDNAAAAGSLGDQFRRPAQAAQLPDPLGAAGLGMIVEIDGLPINLVEADDRHGVAHPARRGYERRQLGGMVKADAARGRGARCRRLHGALFDHCSAARGQGDSAGADACPALAPRRQHEAQQGDRISVLAVAATDYEGTVTLHYNPKVPLTTGASLEAGIRNHGRHRREMPDHRQPRAGKCLRHQDRCRAS